MDIFLINNDLNIKSLIYSFLKHWYIVKDFTDLELYIRNKTFCKTKDGTTIFDILKQLNRIDDIKKIYSDYEFFPLMQDLHDIIDYDLVHKLYDKNPLYNIHEEKNNQTPLQRLTFVKKYHVNQELVKYKKYHLFIKRIKWWKKKDFVNVNKEEDPLSFICSTRHSELLYEFNWTRQDIINKIEYHYNRSYLQLIYQYNENYLLYNNIWKVSDFTTRDSLTNDIIMNKMCIHGSKLLVDLNLFRKEDFITTYKTLYQQNYYNNLYLLVINEHLNIITYFKWWTREDFITVFHMMIEQNITETMRYIINIMSLYNWWVKDDFKITFNNISIIQNILISNNLPVIKDYTWWNIKDFYYGNEIFSFNIWTKNNCRIFVDNYNSMCSDEKENKYVLLDHTVSSDIDNSNILELFEYTDFLKYNSDGLYNLNHLCIYNYYDILQKHKWKLKDFTMINKNGSNGLIYIHDIRIYRIIKCLDNLTVGPFMVETNKEYSALKILCGRSNFDIINKYRHLWKKKHFMNKIFGNYNALCMLFYGIGSSKNIAKILGLFNWWKRGDFLCTTNSGNSLFEYMCINNIDILQYLDAFWGVDDFYTQNRKGKTPMMYALKSNNVYLTKWITKRQHILQKDNSGNMLLHYLCNGLPRLHMYKRQYFLEALKIKNIIRRKDFYITNKNKQNPYNINTEDIGKRIMNIVL